MSVTTADHATAAEAAAIASRCFGIDGEARRMGGADAQNYCCTDSDGRQWVLKLTDPGHHDIIGLQQATLAWLHARAPDFALPVPRPALDGELPEVEFAGHRCLAWMLSHLPGEVLVDRAGEIRDAGRQLGTILGRLDRCLSGFSDSRAKRALRWDIAQGEALRDGLSSINDLARRRLTEEILDRSLDVVARLSPHLRRSVIHGDANDHNLLVRDGSISAIIDFGDVVESWRVAEPAVAAAYHLMDRPDPVASAIDVLEAYHLEWPLTEKEIEAYLPLVEIRLCMTVIHAAMAEFDPYSQVHTAKAWRALERMRGRDSRDGHYRCRARCGLVANPGQPALLAALSAQRCSPVLPNDVIAACVLLDLSKDNAALHDVADDVASLSKSLFDSMQEQGARCGVGRYCENRDLYQSALFVDGNEPRSLHLGVDLYAEAGTPVLAPLPGRVHSFRDNDRNLDYGPTVIVEHELDGLVFYTLYGHLSAESLGRVKTGQMLDAGDTVGWIGDYPANGNWPPHVHFQLISDLLGGNGDFPGVGRLSEAWYWRGICPDPNLVLGLDLDVDARHDDPRPALRDQRDRALNRSLSLSYGEPLLITSGRGAHLYDHRHRAYLDLVNNVSHVGHCHPRVVAAIADQAGQLNTNTRYLHPLIIDYAERLTGLLPAPLEVCFLVCTGSEANELALRLARTATKRHALVALDHAYHGNSSGLIDISAYKFAGPGGSGKPSYVEVLPLPDALPTRREGGELQRALEAIDAMTAAGRPPAALFSETIPGCGGQLILPDGFLAAVYERVREAGGLCVADEVQTGLGRMGDCWWAFETQGLVPDIVTIGKPIGNGHPLSAVVTTREIAERFDNGMEYFNTFGGNAVSCAAGMAVLDVIEQEGLRANASNIGALIRAGLDELATDFDCIADVRGHGLFIGVEITDGTAAHRPDAGLTRQIVENMLQQGILLSIDGPRHNVLKIKPPMVIDRYDCTFFLDRFGGVLQRLAQ